MNGFVLAIGLIGAAFVAIYASVRSGHLADIRIEGNQLQIVPRGANKIWALKGPVSMPLSAVTSARVEGGPHRPQGWRLPGTSIPGMTHMGTYRGKGQTSLYLVARGEALVLELTGQPYDRIVVQSHDAEAVASQLRPRVSSEA